MITSSVRYSEGVSESINPAIVLEKIQEVVAEFRAKQRPENIEEWEWQLRNSISTPQQLEQKLGMKAADFVQLAKIYAIRVSPYYLGLIQKVNDPIWLQSIPNLIEMQDPEGIVDSLAEDEMSPVPGITHRYPDRVLFLIQSQCAMYCRFCTRKRLVGDPMKTIKDEQIRLGIDYIRQHPEVRDVILSGGDPFMLRDDRIDWILHDLRAIPHVEIIRLDSRMPCTLPQRITQQLCDVIKKHHPVYVLTHFNHPSEITPEAKRACELMVDNGIPVMDQTVLLKGVNDDPMTMRKLMQDLLKMRVRPYYLYQADLTKGTEHFRTKVEVGLRIIKEGLRGHTSGLAVPHFVIDCPGGGGKVPLLPEYVLDFNDKAVVMRNFEGKIFEYPQIDPNYYKIQY
jgi:lysine 2,3-aminomutase